MKIDDGSGCFLDSRNDCYGCFLDGQWVGSDSGDHTCASSGEPLWVSAVNALGFAMVFVLLVLCWAVVE